MHFRRWHLGLFTLLLWSLAAPVWGHPHEWVDWGVGVDLDQTKEVKVRSLVLELTWDEWFSAMVFSDFPQLGHGRWGTGDLNQLDTVYGLHASGRAVSLTVMAQGRSLAVKPVIEKPRFNGKTMTLVYRIPLGLAVNAPTELRVSLYDPTFNADMGIRAKAGAFWLGDVPQSGTGGATSFEQDFQHPYYGGAVYPEVVVFLLKSNYK